jgi:hypothetical protein
MTINRSVSGLIAAFIMGCAVFLSSQAAEAPHILRFVEGIDAAAVPMQASDVNTQLNDPWAVLVLRKGVFPKDITETLEALDPPDGQPGYSVQHSFFVSESGQLPVNIAISREFRMVLTRSKPDENLPAILIAAPAGQRDGFIELMSWDPIKKAFNFYRRLKGGEWTWKGDTRLALQAVTAGKGCFQCHVHGTPVMKELRSPWNNWHSQAASIPPEAIPADDIRTSPLFTKKLNAEELEPLVKGWISTAITTMVKDDMKQSHIVDVRTLLRPLFETDTVNLQSSHQRSKGFSAKVDLPPGFFLNFDLFSNVLGLETSPNFSGLVDRILYAAAVEKFGFSLSDGAGFNQPGDTHFGFLVPVPSESGNTLIRQMIDQQVITRHFALSILMVDFTNPFYSMARSGLLHYVPDTGHVQDGRSDLAEKTAKAIAAAAPNTPDGAPERHFLANWDKDPNQLRSDAEQKIQAYQNAVLQRLKTQEGVNDYTQLAESRRRRFASTTLNEFPLLLPQTNLPNNLNLRMLPDGSVSP